MARSSAAIDGRCQMNTAWVPSDTIGRFPSGLNAGELARPDGRNSENSSCQRSVLITTNTFEPGEDSDGDGIADA